MTEPTAPESISQLAMTMHQLAGQLQQISLQLSSLGQQVAALRVASAAPAAAPETSQISQADLLGRLTSLENLVQQLSIRVRLLEQRELTAIAPVLPASTPTAPATATIISADIPADISAEAKIEDDEDEPDEILWDFIEPVPPGTASPH